MFVFRMLLTGLLVALLVSACAPSAMETRGRVHCPACNVELDALFEKHY